MSTFGFEHDYTTEEWRVTYKGEYVLATYTTDELYMLFDKMFKNPTEEKILKYIFAYEMFKRFDSRKFWEFLQDALLTKMFNGVIIKSGVDRRL